MRLRAGRGDGRGPGAAQPPGVPVYSSGLLQGSGAKEDAPCWPLGAVATHLHFDHSSLYCSFHMLPGLFALTLFKLLAFLYLVIVSVCALLDFGIRIRTLLYKE